PHGAPVRAPRRSRWRRGPAARRAALPARGRERRSRGRAPGLPGFRELLRRRYGAAALPQPAGGGPRRRFAGVLHRADRAAARQRALPRRRHRHPGGFDLLHKADEQLQLRGNAVVTNRINGSTLAGPWIDYLRAVRGIRDSAETIALQRPTVTYRVARAEGDTLEPAPYVITGDGMKTRGSSWMVAWGQVLVDRDSLHGRGDSL